MVADEAGPPCGPLSHPDTPRHRRNTSATPDNACSTTAVTRESTVVWVSALKVGNARDHDVEIVKGPRDGQSRYL